MSMELINGTGKAKEQITVTLLCHSDNSQRELSVTPSTLVSQFLEQCLELLAQGEHAERMAEMRKCYQPVLELVENGSGTPLAADHTLAEAGISHQSICQIAAEPLKEELLFCRYAKQA